MSPNSPFPFLAMVHWTGAQNQHPSATTLFSVADATPLGGGVRHGLEEELKNKSLCPTAQGWILVHEPEAASPAATTYLLDAQSRQRIQLPDLAMEQRLIPYCSCLLAGAPTAAGCLVLLVEPAAAFIWYCRVGGGGGGDWTKHEYDIGAAGDEYRADKKLIAPIAAYRDRFYFNAMATEMSVLELRPGAGLAFSSVATELADAERYKQALVFMVRTDDEEEDLYKVVLLHNGGGFDKAKVFRMDFSEHRWCLVDDLGGRAFFVGQMYFGASCVPVAGDGIRRNCVYSLVAAKNTFRIFNLMKEGTFEVQNLAPYELMLETVGKSRLSWVLPTHPRP